LRNNFLFFFEKKKQKTFLWCCYRVLVELEAIFPKEVWAIVNQSNITDDDFAQIRGGNTRTAGHRVFLFIVKSNIELYVWSVDGTFGSKVTFCVWVHITFLKIPIGTPS
jgi:hypothetical protein